MYNDFMFVYSSFSTTIILFLNFLRLGCHRPWYNNYPDNTNLSRELLLADRTVRSLDARLDFGQARAGTDQELMRAQFNLPKQQHIFLPPVLYSVFYLFNYVTQITFEAN